MRRVRRDPEVRSVSVTVRSCLFFFSSRRRHTRFDCDWSSDVCSSDLCAASSVSRRSLSFSASLKFARPPLSPGGGIPRYPMKELVEAIARALVDHPERSEEHTSELQSQSNLVCRLLLEKKKKKNTPTRFLYCQALPLLPRQNTATTISFIVFPLVIQSCFTSFIQPVKSIRPTMKSTMYT